MDLPDSASGMIRNWWQFVSYAANAREADGSFSYGLTDASSAASDINRNVYGGQGGYNPIGLSQLFSIARGNAHAQNALAAADDSARITPNMIAEEPWSRSAADQAALPVWRGRVSFTYTDPDGVQQQGTSMVKWEQILPHNVGSLRTQVQLMIEDQLMALPGTGTPRRGELESIDSIQLLAVLPADGRPRALHKAGREDLHPRGRDLSRYRVPAGYPAGRRVPHAAELRMPAGPAP